MVSGRSGAAIRQRRVVAPRCGDVVWISLDPRVGHEQASRRPAVVVSPASYNKKVGLALLCPVTSQVKGYPFEALIPAGSKIGGLVLSYQVKCLDWRGRHAAFICKLPKSVLREVLSKLNTLLHDEES
jgi:mRNA interferase MazF